MSFSFPAKIEETLVNKKKVIVYTYPYDRIIHRLPDGQILVFWKGNCTQFLTMDAFVRSEVGFIGPIDMDTHRFQGKVLTSRPKDHDFGDLRDGTTIDILTFHTGQIVHIEPNKLEWGDYIGGHKVFCWPTGYSGPCSEYESLETFNRSPTKPIFVGSIDPSTHLRQGFGTRRFFNDTFRATPMPRGWLNTANGYDKYMFTGHFVDGKISGLGQMIYANSSVDTGVFDEFGYQKAQDVDLEPKFRSEQATKENTRHVLSCPSVLLPTSIEYCTDHVSLKYDDGRNFKYY